MLTYPGGADGADTLVFESFISLPAFLPRGGKIQVQRGFATQVLFFLRRQTDLSAVRPHVSLQGWLHRQQPTLLGLCVSLLACTYHLFYLSP